MPGDKPIFSADDALSDVASGAVVMIGGSGRLGVPHALVGALMRRGVGDITCISQACYSDNNDSPDVASLVANGQVTTLVTAPLPGASMPEGIALESVRRGIKIEMVEQGLLAERVRSAGAGVGAFLVKPRPDQTGDIGLERQMLDGAEYVLETALSADIALVRAYVADPLGNLIYKGSARNWNPVMATAATIVVVEVDQVVQIGDLDPELVITPGIYVDRIVIA